MPFLPTLMETHSINSIKYVKHSEGYKFLLQINLGVLTEGEY